MLAKRQSSMLFNSIVFFVFLIVILPVFYGLKKNEHKKIWLLTASYIFYGYWDWRFCSLLLFSSLVDYWVGLKLNDEQTPKKRKRWLQLSLFVNLGLLATFKYFNFFIDSFQSVFDGFGYVCCCFEEEGSFGQDWRIVVLHTCVCVSIY